MKKLLVIALVLFSINLTAAAEYALKEAVKNGSLDAVNQLLGAGVDVNIYNKTSFLHVAAKKGRTEIAKALIEAGADVNAKKYGGLTPLFVAIRYGQIDVAIVLIGAKADVNVKDNQSWTPLHYAVFYDHMEIAKALIDAGADVHIKNNFGETPLNLARSEEHYTELENYITFVLSIKEPGIE